MSEYVFNVSLDGLTVYFDRQKISKCDLIDNISIIENGKIQKATVQIKRDDAYRYMNNILAVMVGDLIVFCGLVKKIETINAEKKIFKITGEHKS